MVSSAVNTFIADDLGCQLRPHPGQDTWQGVRPRPQVDYRHQSLGVCAWRRIHSDRQDIPRIGVDNDSKAEGWGRKHDSKGRKGVSPVTSSSSGAMGHLFLLGSFGWICCDGLGSFLFGSRQLAWSLERCWGTRLEASEKYSQDEETLCNQSFSNTHYGHPGIGYVSWRFEILRCHLIRSACRPILSVKNYSGMS